MVVPFIGEIVIYPYEQKDVPEGWVPCDGRTLPISRNQALYSVLRSTFGGDGSTTFALPNYGGMAPDGSQYYIAVEGIFPNSNYSKVTGDK